MNEFLDTALAFPTVVFTLTTVFLLGFWIVSTVIGAGMNSLDDLDFDFDSDFDADIDLDVDVDVDVDTDLDTDSSGSLIRSALEFLGIAGMPLLIAVNLLSLFSWVTSGIVMVILGGTDNAVGWLLSVPVLIGSFLVGGFLTGRIAKRFAHVFVPTLALRQRQFVGTVCTITTERVSADFGQAEIRDAEGGSMIVQVRCPKENDLGSGDRALIFDLDTDSGVFQISPDRNLAP